VIPQLNRYALFAITDHPLKMENAFQIVVQDSSTSLSLLAKEIVNNATRTALFVTAHLTAKSAIMDSTLRKENAFLNAELDTPQTIQEDAFSAIQSLA